MIPAGKPEGGRAVMTYDLTLRHATGSVTVKRCRVSDPARAIERALDALSTAAAFTSAVRETVATTPAWNLAVRNAA